MFFHTKGGLYAEAMAGLNIRKVSSVPGITKISVPFTTSGTKSTSYRQFSTVQIRFAVTPGQLVSKNQLLGEIICDGVPFPQYAGISGKVKRFKNAFLADNTRVTAVDIETVSAPSEKINPHAEITDYASLVEAMRIYSIIYPDFYFNLISAKKTPSVLIINCLDSDMLSEEQSRIFTDNMPEIFEGTARLVKICGFKKAVIACDTRDKVAYEAAIEHKELKTYKEVEIRFGRPKYPIIPSRVISSLYPISIPVNSSGIEKGFLVLNCSVLYDLIKAMDRGTPCTSCAVTVAGSAAPLSGNYSLPIGTSASTLIEAMGGDFGAICKTVYGGSLSGNAVYRDDVPIERDTGSLYFFDTKETNIYLEHPKCFRCGSCVSVCPVGLFPVKIAENFKSGRYSENFKLNIDSCINCGCCAYICCGKVPLTQYISASKGRIKHNG